MLVLLGWEGAFAKRSIQLTRGSMPKAVRDALHADECMARRQHAANGLVVVVWREGGGAREAPK